LKAEISNEKQIEMETKELLKKVKKIEIKTRRLSDHIFRANTTHLLKGEV